MEDKDDTNLETLFTQISRLEASLFYLEHIIETLDTEIDKHDVEVSIRMLKSMREKKRARLLELISKN